MTINRKPRTFSDSVAVRSQVPLLVGLAGPSGGGKTFSALRLAVGMQRVSGGDIYGIDTESNRMLHYADRFKFRHVPFGAPFDPLSYLECVKFCADKGAKIIIIDSMSHEHEGPGGVLDMHTAECERLSRGDPDRVNAIKMLAWGIPKQARRRLLNSLLQIPCHFVFCFRAKEKVKMAKGQDPKPEGFMPIAGDEFVFEMTVNGLLLPNAGGIPTWNPQEDGEKRMVKLPEQFRQMLLSHKAPLDESLGERMAQWASGSDPVSAHRRAIETAATMDELAAAWKSWIDSPISKTSPSLVAMKDARKAAIAAGQAKENKTAKPPHNPATDGDPEPGSPEEAEALRRWNQDVAANNEAHKQ